MTLKLEFKPQDFADFKSFEKAMTKQLGNHIYVGTDSCCLYFEYPKEMKAMLRPYPEKEQLSFELVSSKN